MAKTAENDDGSAIISADTPSFSNLMRAINSRIYLLLIASIRFENDGVSAEIIALPISTILGNTTYSTLSNELINS